MIRNDTGWRNARGGILSRVAVVLVVVAVVAAVVLNWNRLEGDPPVAAFDREFQYMGRTPELGLRIEDTGSGLREVRVVLEQDEETVVLVEETFPETAAPAVREYALGELIAEGYDPQEGPAALVVDAADHGLRRNRIEARHEFEFDIYPPSLEVLSPLLYMTQGGSENVVYRVSEDAVSSGVQVGPHFFPGYPAGTADDPDRRFALFALAYDVPADAPITLVARDAAGNEAVAGVAARVSARNFRQREIAVDDAFLRKVVPEIVSRSPQVEDQGSLIDTYVEINGRLRELNHQRIAELSRDSADEFLWTGGFLQLSNSQVESMFADRRTYTYMGEVVDHQDHVGFDLSVVERYPIEATNDGRVLLAEYFGIYGNTVLIDHGVGLVSLYGHLSSIAVEPGQTVSKGEAIGRSGQTGLAGGDHLHFGLFLHGVPVNPIEWWDPRWVEEHILDPLAPDPPL